MLLVLYIHNDGTSSSAKDALNFIKSYFSVKCQAVCFTSRNLVLFFIVLLKIRPGGYTRTFTFI